MAVKDVPTYQQNNNDSNNGSSAVTRKIHNVTGNYPIIEEVRPNTPTSSGLILNGNEVGKTDTGTGHIAIRSDVPDVYKPQFKLHELQHVKQGYLSRSSETLIGNSSDYKTFGLRNKPESTMYLQLNEFLSNFSALFDLIYNSENKNFDMIKSSLVEQSGLDANSLNNIIELIQKAKSLNIELEELKNLFKERANDNGGAASRKSFAVVDSIRKEFLDAAKKIIENSNGAVDVRQKDRAVAIAERDFRNTRIFDSQGINSQEELEFKGRLNSFISPNDIKKIIVTSSKDFFGVGRGYSESYAKRFPNKIMNNFGNKMQNVLFAALGMDSKDIYKEFDNSGILEDIKAYKAQNERFTREDALRAGGKGSLSDDDFESLGESVKQIKSKIEEKFKLFLREHVLFRGNSSKNAKYKNFNDMDDVFKAVYRDNENTLVDKLFNYYSSGTEDQDVIYNSPSANANADIEISSRMIRFLKNSTVTGKIRRKNLDEGAVSSGSFIDIGSLDEESDYDIAGAVSYDEDVARQIDTRNIDKKIEEIIRRRNLAAKELRRIESSENTGNTDIQKARKEFAIAQKEMYDAIHNMDDFEISSFAAEERDLFDDALRKMGKAHFRLSGIDFAKGLMDDTEFIKKGLSNLFRDAVSGISDEEIESREMNGAGFYFNGIKIPPYMMKRFKEYILNNVKDSDLKGSKYSSLFSKKSGAIFISEDELKNVKDLIKLTEALIDEKSTDGLSFDENSNEFKTIMSSKDDKRNLYVMLDYLKSKERIALSQREFVKEEKRREKEIDKSDYGTYFSGETLTNSLSLLSNTGTAYGFLTGGDKQLGFSPDALRSIRNFGFTNIFNENGELNRAYLPLKSLGDDILSSYKTMLSPTSEIMDKSKQLMMAITGRSDAKGHENIRSIIKSILSKVLDKNGLGSIDMRLSGAEELKEMVLSELQSSGVVVSENFGNFDFSSFLNSIKNFNNASSMIAFMNSGTMDNDNYHRGLAYRPTGARDSIDSTTPAMAIDNDSIMRVLSLYSGEDVKNKIKKLIKNKKIIGLREDDVDNFAHDLGSKSITTDENGDSVLVGNNILELIKSVSESFYDGKIKVSKGSEKDVESEFSDITNKYNSLIGSEIVEGMTTNTSSNEPERTVTRTIGNSKFASMTAKKAILSSIKEKAERMLKNSLKEEASSNTYKIFGRTVDKDQIDSYRDFLKEIIALRPKDLFYRINSNNNLLSNMLSEHGVDEDLSEIILRKMKSSFDFSEDNSWTEYINHAIVSLTNDSLTNENRRAGSENIDKLFKSFLDKIDVIDDSNRKDELLKINEDNMKYFSLRKASVIRDKFSKELDALKDESNFKTPTGTVTTKDKDGNKVEKDTFSVVMNGEMRSITLGLRDKLIGEKEYIVNLLDKKINGEKLSEKEEEAFSKYITNNYGQMTPSRMLTQKDRELFEKHGNKKDKETLASYQDTRKKIGDAFKRLALLLSLDSSEKYDEIINVLGEMGSANGVSSDTRDRIEKLINFYSEKRSDKASDERNSTVLELENNSKKMAEERAERDLAVPNLLTQISRRFGRALGANAFSTNENGEKTSDTFLKGILSDLSKKVKGDDTVFKIDEIKEYILQNYKEGGFGDIFRMKKQVFSDSVSLNDLSEYLGISGDGTKKLKGLSEKIPLLREANNKFDYGSLRDLFVKLREAYLSSRDMEKVVNKNSVTSIDNIIKILDKRISAIEEKELEEAAERAKIAQEEQKKERERIDKELSVVKASLEEFKIIAEKQKDERPKESAVRSFIGKHYLSGAESPIDTFGQYNPSFYRDDNASLPDKIMVGNINRIGGKNNESKTMLTTADIAVSYSNLKKYYDKFFSGDKEIDDRRHIVFDDLSKDILGNIERAILDYRRYFSGEGEKTPGIDELKELGYDFWDNDKSVEDNLRNIETLTSSLRKNVTDKANAQSAARSLENFKKNYRDVFGKYVPDNWQSLSDESRPDFTSAINELSSLGTESAKKDIDKLKKLQEMQLFNIVNSRKNIATDLSGKTEPAKHENADTINAIGVDNSEGQQTYAGVPYFGGIDPKILNQFVGIVKEIFSGLAREVTLKEISKKLDNLKVSEVSDKKSEAVIVANVDSKNSEKNSAVESAEVAVEKEKRRRKRISSSMPKDGSNNGIYDINKIEKSEFDAKYSELKTDKEKLSILEERMRLVKPGREAGDETSILEYNRLRKKRASILSKNEKEKYKYDLEKYKTELRNGVDELLKKRDSISDDEFIKEINKKIASLKRRKDFDAKNTGADNNKRIAIMQQIGRLESVRGGIDFDPSLVSAKEEIKKYREIFSRNDSSFDARIKGMSIKERLSETGDEVKRLDNEIAKLIEKRAKAIEDNNKYLEEQYDYLISKRVKRRDVVLGKHNAAEKSFAIAEENAKKRADKASELDSKREEKRLNALASSHDKEGNQARSVFNKAVEYGAMSTLVYGFASEAKNAVDVMSRFERQMVEVTKVMDPLYQSQEMLTESAKRMAIEYGVSIVEAAKGMAVFAQQGKNASQIVRLTEASLLAANTTTLDAAQSTEALTAAIRQFNLTDADAQKVIDSWLEVESRTAISASTMADAIKISGTAARVAGLSFDEFNGIVSAVGSATRETGSQLGTAFKFIISKMRTDDAITALQKLGIATHNQSGDFRDLMTVLSDLNARWVQMTQEQKASTAITIAGTRRYNTLMTLMEQWDNALEAISMSEDSHGKAMRMNAAVMDTYEKRVQKAKASVEAFYASMSKGTTKSFLGGIQDSISLLAQAGEKTPLADTMAQMGVIAGTMGLISRVSGNMGLGAALGDMKANGDIRKEIGKVISGEIKAIKNENGSLIGTKDTARNMALDRLTAINSGTAKGAMLDENNQLMSVRDELAQKITERIAGNNKETELYQSTLKRVQNEISRTITSHQEYIGRLDKSGSAVKRFGIATSEFAKRHAIAMAAIGMGLQSLANSEIFKDKHSMTGKTSAGEAIDLIGTAGTALGAGLMTAKFAGAPAGIAVGAMTLLGPVISTIQSWSEKIGGSQRLTLLRLQEESDRIKTLTSSVDTYAKLRDKERGGQSLTLEEQEQKRTVEQNIALAYPAAIKKGHRGIGLALDEKEIDNLVGGKSAFKDKYARINDQMAYEQMFSGAFGGKTISESLLSDLNSDQSQLEKLVGKLEAFDSEHTGELSRDDYRTRQNIIEEIRKVQESIGKNTEAINKTEQAYFAAIRNSESDLLNASRRGDTYEVNEGPNAQRKKMFEQLVANRGGGAAGLAAARKAFAEAELSAILPRGTAKNRDSAIKNAEETGILYTATRGKTLEDGRQEIVLHTRAADGSMKKSEAVTMNAQGSANSYIKELAAMKGINSKSIAFLDDLSDALFRYSLKEIEKFAELTRKIGDTIYTSYKNEVDRISSLEGVSSRFRIGGIETQYNGANIRLDEARRGAKDRAAAIGTVDDNIISEIIGYSREKNQSKAMSLGANISAKLATHNTLAGSVERLVMAMGTQNQKGMMASQIIETLHDAKFKVPRGRDDEAEGFLEERKRIDEYLAAAGLGHETFDSIQQSLGQSASDADIKQAIISRVTAAADVFSKKDADEISKYFRIIENEIENLANTIKKAAEVISIERQNIFANNINSSGIISSSDVVNSYVAMSSRTSMYDEAISRMENSVKKAEAGINESKAIMDAAKSAKDNALTKHGNDSLQYVTALGTYERARQNYEQASKDFQSSTEKLDNLKELQAQVKSIATASYGEHKAFMRTVEADAIDTVARGKRVSFGIGSSQHNEIAALSEYKNSLEGRQEELKLEYDRYSQMAKNGTLTDAQKTEMKSIELQLGEIEKALRDNGQKLDTANISLEKSYAEARRNSRKLQLENLANTLSGSKDTGRSQKAFFDDNYNRMRGLWRDYVAAMQQNPNAVSDVQKMHMQELAKKMESLRDVGDLMGNPAFNKNYLLASAQDQAIADNIMERLQSGETMRQIFSDAGIKEMGRNNPLISQLIDNMMQKQENQRLADVSNQMLAVETEMLGYLKNISGLMSNPVFATQVSQNIKSNEQVTASLSGGTTFTGSGGKFESAGLVEVHKGEGLGVLSQTAMARYPMMSRKVLKMISDMNTGTYPGFANGTRMARDVFSFGDRNSILGLGKDVKLKLYVPDDNLRALAEIMKVDVSDIWTTANGKSASDKVAGFNQNGKIFINGGAGRGVGVHEIIHGVNGTQFGGYNTGREAMSIFAEMAIGGSKNTGYSNFFTKQAYSGLNLGSNPAKNAQAIFDILAKGKNYKYQWEGINSGLRGLSNNYLTSELGTKSGNIDFKHGYAQAASVIAEYGLKTGTSSQKDINKMFKSLDRLFKKATGSSSIEFSAHSGQNFSVKEFAQACAEFRASVDKNSATLSHNEVLASMERRATQNRENKREQSGVKTNSSANFKENYQSLRRERELDRFYGKKYGVILRDGKAYSAYNPIERIRQSRVADFLRLGGIRYGKDVALDYGKNVVINSKDLAVSSYRRTVEGIKTAGNGIVNVGRNVATKVGSAAGYYYDTRIKPGFSMAYDGISKPIKNAAQGVVNGLNNVYTERIKPGVSMAAEDIARFSRRAVKPVADFGRNIYLNRTNSGLQKQIDAAMHGEDFVEAFRLNNLKNNLPQNRAKRFAGDIYQRVRDSRFGRDVRLRRAIVAQGLEDFGSSIKGGWNNSKKFISFAKDRFVEDYRNNLDITKGIWDGTGGRVARGANRLYRGTVNAYNSLREGLTPEAMMNRRAMILSQGKISGVPGFGPRLTVSQRFKAEALRQAANFVSSPVNYLTNPLRKIGDIRIPGTTARNLNLASKSSGGEVSRGMFAPNIARPMTIREFTSSIADGYRERAEQRRVQREQRKEASNRAREEARQARVQAAEARRLNAARRRLAITNGARNTGRYIQNAASWIGKGFGKVSEAASSAGISPMSAAFALVNVKNAFDAGKVAVTGRRLNSASGKYEKVSNDERAQAMFDSAINLGFTYDQLAKNGGKFAKFGGVGGILTAGNVAKKALEGNYKEALFTAGTSLAYNPMARNLAAKGLNSVFGNNASAFFRPGKSFSVGMGLDLVGNLGASYFGENTLTGNVFKDVSRVGRLAQFATPGGALLGGGMATAQELWNLGGWDGEGGDSQYVLSTGQALEALSKEYGDSGSWYSPSTVAYALDTVLLGALGTKEKAGVLAGINAKKDASSMAIRGLKATVNAKVNEQKAVSFGANASEKDFANNAITAALYQNELFKKAGLSDSELINTGAVGVMAIASGKGAGEIFEKYNFSDANDLITEKMAHAANLRAEAEKYQYSAQGRTLSRLWGAHEDDSKKAQELIAIAEREEAEAKKIAKQRANSESFVAEQREAVQEHFNGLYGRKVNVFETGGLLTTVREQAKQEKIQNEQKQVANNEKLLAEARESYYKQVKTNYSFGSVGEMEHEARLGNEQAKQELQKFNEAVSNQSYKGRLVSDISKEIDEGNKRISALNNQKVDGSGLVTGEEFAKMRNMSSEDYEVALTTNSEEQKKLNEQLARAKEDLKLMQGTSDAASVKKQQELVSNLESQIGTKRDEESEYKAQVAARKLVEELNADRSQYGERIIDPDFYSRQISTLNAESRDAASALNNKQVLRELAANGRATVNINGQNRDVTKDELIGLRDNKNLVSEAQEAKEEAEKEFAAILKKERIRQQIARDKDIDASDVDDLDIEAEIEADGYRKRGEDAERENAFYGTTVFGKRDAAEAAYNDAVKARNDNNKRIAELENKEISGKLTEEEAKELKEAQGMQLYYDRAVDKAQSGLNTATTSVAQRQKAVRNGRGGDTRLIGLSDKDFEKERNENEEQIRLLEEKKKNGTLGESGEKELSRRKNMTRTLFAESELVRFDSKKKELDRLRTKKASGKLTEEEQKRLTTLSNEDFSEEARAGLQIKIDEAYSSQNGGLSFDEIQEQERRARRGITFANASQRNLVFNRETGKYEVQEIPGRTGGTVDERIDALSGEDAKATADVFNASTQRTTGISGTSQATAGDDKNIEDISKNTSSIEEIVGKIFEKMIELMRTIPSSGGSEGSSNTTPKEGDVVPGI